MYKKITILLFFSICFWFCKKDKKSEPSDPEKSTFDQKGMLQNFTDSIILPGYLDFSKSLDSLDIAFADFKNSPATITYASLKLKLNRAYKNYQSISIFELGPGEQQMMRMNFNIFPTDTIQIKANIASGSYNLNDANNNDAKGLPALDYLISDYNKTEQQIIQSYGLSAKQKYVEAVIADMKSRTNSVLQSWNTSYKTQFVSSQGTSIGSSVGLLVNQLNFELDFLKNYKIGIPLGKKTLNLPMPQDCEAFYSGQSLEYILNNLAGIEALYSGRNRNGTDGSGFDDYLDNIGAQYAGGSLNATIRSQFDLARTKLKALNGKLSDLVKNNPSPVNESYTELLKLLVLLKTDLPSSLGVVITYQDGDGD